eukprot:CAMPEP_0196657210 /NCGR_PEP_ID=MMETSP1086-20130531/22506_1 /TAXON_ID=77921 /ORGANISM="Cyanoptyche  gloeocystis , Strain SAG4.97" /LENGTH=165 /DNA_ID=CAMNT_0041990255 /DNA_START=84 /DNA_END=581 /DNA_ORIENTATION=-
MKFASFFVLCLLAFSHADRIDKVLSLDLTGSQDVYRIDEVSVAGNEDAEVIAFGDGTNPDPPHPSIKILDPAEGTTIHVKYNEKFPLKWEQKDILSHKLGIQVFLFGHPASPIQYAQVPIDSGVIAAQTYFPAGTPAGNYTFKILDGANPSVYGMSGTIIVAPGK